MDISRQAVSRWERDETMPETDKVVALADLFAVTTDYLLQEQAEPETQPECTVSDGNSGGRCAGDPLSVPRRVIFLAFLFGAAYLSTGN